LQTNHAARDGIGDYKAVLLAAGTSGFAKDVSAEARAGVEKTIAEMGCTTDVDDDVEGDGDGYKLMDVECKDGRYGMMFDKDYKLTKKTKED
jgi:hypothetical protein